MNNKHSLIEKYSNQVDYDFVEITEECSYKRTTYLEVDDYRARDILLDNSKYFIRGNNFYFSCSIENESRTHVYAEAVFENLYSKDKLLFGLSYFSCGYGMMCKDILPYLFIPTSVILYRNINKHDEVSVFIGSNIQKYATLKDNLEEYIVYKSKGGIILKFD